MNDRKVAWRKLLSEAADRADDAVEEVRAKGDRTTSVGAGASGDKTLLADREAERAFLETLSGVHGLRLLSEEAGEVGDKRSKNLAVLDPLDGSSNFERGIPFYCTSVGVTSDGSLAGIFVALVRDLARGDVFYAEKGKGAWKNWKPIRTSPVTELSQAVAGVDLSRTTTEKAETLAPLLASVRRQVHFGACALELCLLAEGKIDAYVDTRGAIRVTDFAGAYLIAREAGAVITSDTGAELDPRMDLSSRFGFVASANPSLHWKLLALCDGGRVRRRTSRLSRR
jgi:myo-inositol-1(or 4)-monophosphatase